jgi:hypothetical protein
MAAYFGNFVLSVIDQNGNPVREKNESGERTARIAFDTEYKLRLKNQRHVRAKVKVFIDGMDVNPNGYFILGANESLDLERFITDGDLVSGSKFKFTSQLKGALTGELQDPFSSQLGRITAKFYPESTWGNVTFRSPSFTHSPPYYVTPTYGTIEGSINTLFHSCVNTAGKAASGVLTTNAIGLPADATIGHASSTVTSCNLNDKGGTAMGGHSDQQFVATQQDFFTAAPVEISITLKGLNVAAGLAYGTSALADVKLSNQGVVCSFHREVPPKYCVIEGNMLVVRIPMSDLNVG